jgi:hypothetical protein
MKFKQFINKHKGQRCFILGCAPSLKQEKLSLLKNEIVIICNKGFLAKDELGLPNFTYFFVGDGIVYKELHEKYKKQLDGISVPRFYSSKVADVSQIDIQEDYVKIKKNYDIKNAIERTGFPKNFDDGWGVTRATVIDASIIAFWMGFKEIYLLGVDYDYSKPESTHFYKSGPREKFLVKNNKVAKPQSKAIKRITKALQIVQTHLNKNGVTYKNLSKGFIHKHCMDTDILENIIK